MAFTPANKLTENTGFTSAADAIIAAQKNEPSSLDIMGAKAKEVLLDPFTSRINAVSDRAAQNGQGIVSSGLQTGAALIGGAYDVLGKGVGSALSAIPQVADELTFNQYGLADKTNKLTQGAGNIIGEGVGGIVKGAKYLANKALTPEQQAKVAEAAKNHPELVGNIEALANIALEGKYGQLKDVGTAIGKGTVAGAKMGGEAGMSAVGAVKDASSKAVSAVTPDSADIMQRVARISKTKQANFEQRAGESIGSFLDKRGIYNNIEENLYKRFQASKNTADEALSSLKGSFAPAPIKTALGELKTYMDDVSSVGAPAPELNRVSELLNKVNTDGLTMSEINEVKRLYERNVKLDFLKSNNPKGVVKANVLDNAIRDWQVKQAEELGLKNLPEINKETMLNKQLLDDIGKEYAGSTGNNGITLTDWIMLSGGSPEAIAGFLTKKTFSSKGVQGYIAKKLSKNKDKIMGVPADMRK